jgi:hypothetical protein
LYDVFLLHKTIFHGALALGTALQLRGWVDGRCRLTVSIVNLIERLPGEQGHVLVAFAEVVVACHEGLGRTCRSNRLAR